MENLRTEAQSLIAQNRHEDALRVLNQLLRMLEDEGLAGQEIYRSIRDVRNQVALQWGFQLLEQDKHAAAQAALEQADPSAIRDEGLARVHFGARRYAQAFAQLDLLHGANPQLATRLRGHFHQQLGALPLAVAQYERLAGTADIDLLLSQLERIGLRRFERSTQQGWTVFRAIGTRSTRTLAYWFPASAQGGLDGTHPVELAVRPAPRKLSLGLVLRNLIRLRWPDSDNALEYSLTVWGEGRGDIVALWDREPSAQDIIEAAGNGLAALPELRQAEELLHSRRAGEALAIARAKGRTNGWFFPPQPNYSALVKAVQAAVETGDEAAAQQAAAELADWHPMWGRLALARAYEDANRPAKAREAFEQAIAAAPLRWEAYEKAADFEWADAAAEANPDKAASFLLAQRAARRLEAVKPVAGLWLRARIANELKAHALTGALLRRLNALPDAPEAALELQVLLEQLQQARFQQVGEDLPAGEGLRLRAFRTREPAPQDAGLMHHSAEILVLDGEDNLVEVFAISSQGVPPGAPRQFMLDRINAMGLQTLRIYGARAPSLDRVIKGVAAL